MAGWKFQNLDDTQPPNDHSFSVATEAPTDHPMQRFGLHELPRDPAFLSPRTSLILALDLRQSDSVLRLSFGLTSRRTAPRNIQAVESPRTPPTPDAPTVQTKPRPNGGGHCVIRQLRCLQFANKCDQTDEHPLEPSVRRTVYSTNSPLL